MTAVLSIPLLSRSHVPKIPKKTFPLLTNDHRPFHNSAPLFKKKKSQRFIEKQVAEPKKTKSNQKHFENFINNNQPKKKENKQKNQFAASKKSQLSNYMEWIEKGVKLESRPLKTYQGSYLDYYIEYHIDKDYLEKYIQSYNINKEKQRLQQISNQKVVKPLINKEKKPENNKAAHNWPYQFQNNSAPVKKPKKRSYREKIFFEMCKEEALRDKD